MASDRRDAAAYVDGTLRMRIEFECRISFAGRIPLLTFPYHDITTELEVG